MADILYGDDDWLRADLRPPLLDGQVIVCTHPGQGVPQVFPDEARDGRLPAHAFAWRPFPRAGNAGWLERGALARFIPAQGRLWICIQGGDWAGRFGGALFPLAMIEPRPVEDVASGLPGDQGLLGDASIEAFMPIAVWERGDVFDPLAPGTKPMAPRSPLGLQSLSNDVRLYIGFF